VLWLEVVLPNGDVIQTGSKTLKSGLSSTNPPYSLVREGSLGVVTQVVFEDSATPESYATSFHTLGPTVRQLARATPQIRRAGMVPEMLEFME